MINFTAIEWVKIEAANQFGWDKKTYPERLNLGSEIFEKVKTLGVDETLKQYDADEPELFLTALYAMEDYINKRPSGIPVRADAASSGAQLLSVLMKDLVGMRNTGSLGSKVPDVYTTIYELMQRNGASAGLTRKQVKEGTIPYIYGSTLVPNIVFGDQVDLFKTCYYNTIPAADLVSQLLIDAWDSTCIEYSWELPDGFVATTTPVDNFSYRIPFLDHSLTYQTKEVCPVEKGGAHTKALSANVTHSFDAYMLRELHRRCNFNPAMIDGAINTIIKHDTKPNPELERMEKLSNRFNQVSVRAAEFLYKNGSVGNCSDKYLLRLEKQLRRLKDPFEVMSIHDEFMCLPNHMNQMKATYNRLLAEAYKSNWLVETVCELREDKEVLKYVGNYDPTVFKEILHAPYTIF